MAESRIRQRPEELERYRWRIVPRLVWESDLVWLVWLAPFARAAFVLAKTEPKYTVVFKALLIATFGLTLWQARWAYFFVMIFAMAVPELLSVVRKPVFATALFIIALFPIAQAWDRMFTDEELARRTENNVEKVEVHAIASQCGGPFIAPWWFSPALSYWSRQPGIGGSSHESIKGIVETARFFRNARSGRSSRKS